MISINILYKESINNLKKTNFAKNTRIIDNFYKINKKKKFSDVCSSSNSNKELGQNFNISLSKNSSGNKTIFFDFQSTTPVDPRVLDAMLPYLTVRYGNPHSKSHEYGWEADKAVENAREVSFYPKLNLNFIRISLI
jgi:hypothetical protein